MRSQSNELHPESDVSGAGAAVFKDILFTVDLEHADSWLRALPIVLEAATASGARLHVMTVVPEVAVPALMQAGPFDYEAQLVPKAEAALDQFLRERVPAGVPVQPIVTYGSVYKEILRVAAEIRPDLIVMAAHRPQPGDFLIGSNAERVSRRAHCTVMLVR
jgi:nucleotide-binding universal stress UspA family protein